MSNRECRLRKRGLRSENPDQPTKKRWRPWRPQDSSSSDSAMDSEDESPNSKGLQGRNVPYYSDNVTARADVIPLFDPEISGIFAATWLNKIEQLGSIHNWTTEMKSYFMQSRLSGIAKVWHSSLPDYKFSWVQWKEKLLEAFPRSIDYVESLREMLSRKKIATESMIQYYYNKNALLTRLEIDGENAVSCIIDGLPNFMKAPARAGNFKTPSDLYAKFLTNMEDGKPKAFVPPIRYQSAGVTSSDNKLESNVKEFKKPLCFVCQESGHTFRRCFKNPQNASKPACTHCKRIGHSSEKCWYKPTMATSTSASALNSKQPSVNIITKQVNDAYFKEVEVNDFPARAYLDSGARINVVNSIFVDKLNLKMQSCDLLIGGFGGYPIPAKGSVNVRICIDKLVFDTQLIVTDWHMREMDLIIGQPIINEPSIELLINGNNIEIRKKELDLPGLVENEQIKFKVLCKEEATVPPNSIMIIEVTTDAKDNDPVLIDSSRISYNDFDYAIPSCIIQGGQSAIEVSNVSKSSLKLHKGQLLARGILCELAELSVNNEESSQIQNNVMRIDITKIKCGVDDPEVQNELREIVTEYADCFSMTTEEIGCTDKIKMKIDLHSDKPVCYRPYRLSVAEKEVVREKIDDLTKNNIIRDSSSAYSSPIILVKKKNGDYRLCVDYRKLNSNTVKDKYPLPIIEDQVEKLAGKKFFTSLDLSQGFYQIPMSEDSIHKTGFVTPEGHYEFLRMPFGLANSPCVFQRLMDKILGALRFDRVLPYIDDLLIPTATVEEGMNTLRTVLDILRDAKLTLNLDKCTFLQSKLEYLGYDISESGVRPGEKKIEAVAKYKEPCNVHELRMFLGLTSYFRKFVQNYATLTHDLYSLLKKDMPWQWSIAQQAAFDNLKSILTKRPLLALYDSKLDTEVHTDASSKGIAGILLQKHDESLRPVAYFSRKTSKEEAMYHSFELETLAVVESLKRFRVYVAGIEFKVVTDCVAVRQTFEKKDLMPRVARWWMSIQEYNMHIIHKPGISHKHVDALSRAPINSITYVNVLDIFDWVVCLQNKDHSLKIIKQKLENKEADLEISNNYCLKDGKIYRLIKDDQMRLVVPKAARWNIMRKYHDDIGHPGLKRCELIIKENCWFPRMTRFIRKYVDACIDCLYKRGQYGRQEGNLHPIEKIPEPLNTLHIDHLGPFCRSAYGKSYLFVVVDSYTKFVWAVPTKTTKSSEVEEKLEDIFTYFGYPKRLISDSGAAFTSKRFKQFCTRNQIKHVTNAIASPRSNGQVERFNRTLLEAINKSTTEERDWDKCLGKVVWGMNNMVNSSTGFTPYRLMFQAKRARFQGMLTNEHDDEVLAAQNKEQASRNLSKTATTMKKHFNKKRKSPTLYAVGDLVLWKGAQDKNKDAVRKLKEKYSGPYKVKRVLGNDRYIIVSIKGLKGYKKYQATVASDSLRRFEQTDTEESNSDSNESPVDSTEELIDLLEG